jgi:hypothetical protein
MQNSGRIIDKLYKLKRTNAELWAKWSGFILKTVKDGEKSYETDLIPRVELCAWQPTKKEEMLKCEAVGEKLSN